MRQLELETFRCKNSIKNIVDRNQEYMFIALSVV